MAQGNDASGREALQVQDVEFLPLTGGDQVRARALRRALERLAEERRGGGRDALGEMAREVLAGRMGLREAVRVGAYADALADRVGAARHEYERQSPESRAGEEAEARRYLAGLRSEIDAERAPSRR